ncbi:zinc finger CCHC domain-containing protein 9 [Parasteatoda tepidariorum]|uniref:zinc finger CCHC domain-containing protein 9 n=1 Tax=Parasteatoda tepidariorum TaxID=114398 RepID=UPI00077FCAC5|nr:zinc finger CCHC domain-containing protein 9 [Parasteatoda tepidariorum]
MSRTKKAAIMARKEKAAKKAHTKKSAKFKKNRKLPDATPWEELSKNIKGKLKSKNENENQNKIQSIVSKDSVNEKNNDELNYPETNNGQLQEISLKNSLEPVHTKKKKLKNKLYTSTKNIRIDAIVKNIHENNQNDLTEKLEESNDCESSNPKGQESLSAKQLSKYEKKKLKKQKKKLSDSSSPLPAEKSDNPAQLKSKKLSKRRLEKNKLYEKKRLERRKELGIMLLPKNIESKLLRIRKALKKKNLSTEEIKDIMRKERRKAQDEFRKSHANQMCFNCRKPGHLVANCPSNEDNKAASICLKCGSTDHKYTTCKKEITGFPFATCFICKEQGHISRDCPINEHGIYPKGGKCSLCDSIKHLRKDCPTLNSKKKGSSVTLNTIDKGTSIDDEVVDTEQATPKVKMAKPKVVVF